MFHPCRYLRAWLFGTVLMSIAISIGLHYLFASPLPYLLFLAVALSLQTFLLGVLPGRARIEFDGSAFDAFDCWGKWKGRVRAKEIGPVGLWSGKKEFPG